MAGDMATLGVRITLDGAENAARGMDRVKESAGGLEHAVEGLEGAMAKIRTAFGLGLFGFEFLNETIAAQNAMAQLEAGVRSTGAAAGFSAPQLHEQAMALEEVTAFSHTAIEATQGIFLMFEKLSGVQFEEATKAAADLATRMGTDMPSAAHQLGKALEDPATGLLMLRRAGVIFTAGQAEMIKEMELAGNATAAQALILDLLTAKLGGSAAAARDTLGGALKGLQHDFANLFEVTRGSSGPLVSVLNDIGLGLRFAKEHAGLLEAAMAVLATTVIGRNLTALVAYNAQIRLGAIQNVEAVRAQATYTESLVASAIATREQAVWNAQLAESYAVNAKIAIGYTIETKALAAANREVIVTDLALVKANEAVTAATLRVAEAQIAEGAAVAELATVTTAAGAAIARAGALAATGWALIGGWIGATIIAAIAVNALLDKYIDKQQEAAAQTEEQAKATDHALSVERARNAAIRQAADDAASAAVMAAKANAERDAETAKLRTLNGAYNQSALSLQILGIQLDANIAKVKAHKDVQQAEWAALDGSIDRMKRTQIAAAQLAYALQATAKMRDLVASGQATTTGAQSASQEAAAQIALNKSVTDGVITSDQAAASLSRLTLQHETAAKAVAALVTLTNDLRGAGMQEQKDAVARYNLTISDIGAWREWQRTVIDANDDAAAATLRLANARAQAVAQIDTANDVVTRVEAMRQETDETNRQYEAALRGAKAQRDLTIVLAGEHALQEAMNAANAKGIALTLDQANAISQAAEALERAKLQTNDLLTVTAALGDIMQAAFDGSANSIERAITGLRQIVNVLAAEHGDGWGKALAGLGGFSAGYGIGQSTGNSTTGVLGGAASGAAAGAAFGPWGAAIGGLAGAAGGLLGAAKAQKEAAEAQKKAAEQARLSLLQMNAQAGTGTSLASQIAQAQAQANALFDAIDAALPGLKNQVEREKELAQVRVNEGIIIRNLIDADAALQKANEAAAQRAMDDLRIRLLTAQGNTASVRQLQEQIEVQDAITAGRGEEYLKLLLLVQATEDQAAANAKAAQAATDAAAATERVTQMMEDLTARALRASGQGAAADAAQLAAQQRQEIAVAIAANDTPEQIALIRAVQILETAQANAATAAKAQTDVLNAQLKTAQDQLQAAQQSLSALKQVHDSLAAYGLSLKIGAQSPLSPAQQLDEARRQVTALYQAALGGDVTAAGNFSGAANSFLQASRGYNASGAGYTMDFNSVSTMTDTLTSQFGLQASLAQQTVNALNAQIVLMQQQIVTLQNSTAIVSITPDSLNHIGALLFQLMQAGLYHAPGGFTDPGLFDPGQPNAPTPPPIIPVNPFTLTSGSSGDTANLTAQIIALRGDVQAAIEVQKAGARGTIAAIDTLTQSTDANTDVTKRGLERIASL